MTEKFPRNVVCAFLDVFKLARPLLGPRACRFSPSCTQYAEDAVRKHGVFKGLFLSAGRLLRCHPFNAGGFDPVP